MLEGFIGFTDVQVQSSIICNCMFLGFVLGALFADGTYFVVKYIIRRIKKKGANDA